MKVSSVVHFISSFLLLAPVQAQEDSDYGRHLLQQMRPLLERYGDVHPKYPELAEELVAMAKKDQDSRKGALSQIDEKKMGRVDRTLTARLKQIIKKYGWPTIPKAGWQGSQDALLILVHSPEFQFQKQLLPVVKDLFAHEKIAGGNIALLEDKILVAEHKLQRFGTQTSIDHGKMRIMDMEDPAHVDERRLQYQPPPLREYKQFLSQVYHMPVE